MKTAGSGLLFILFLVFMSISCKRSEGPRRPVAGGALSPRTGSQAEIERQEASSEYSKQNGSQVLINLGIGYSVVALVDGNLDSEQSDEQILVVLPLDKPQADLELLIASVIPARKQYGVVKRLPLQTGTLTGITLNLDDITGNGGNELIVSGFDEKGLHITKIYSVPQNGEITDIITVFDAKINGNIDIDSGANRANASTSLSIVVQEIDAQNNLDFIETTWTWNSAAYTFKPGSPRRVEFDTILEERMKTVYTGDAEEYKKYLSGPWYRKNGSETLVDYVFFDPERDEILFHSGSIQEAYRWGVSNRTTARRLYAQLKNEIIPSIVLEFSINAESWDEISINSNTDWDGNYYRLNPKLQRTLEVEEAPLSSMLTGIWQGQNGAELVFDLPRIQWSENGSVRTGIASLFSLNDELVLQIQYIKENGAMEEAVNWLVEYEEKSDPPRKSISLIQAQLKMKGARANNLNPRRFEQIAAPQ